MLSFQSVQQCRAVGNTSYSMPQVASGTSKRSAAFDSDVADTYEILESPEPTMITLLVEILVGLGRGTQELAKCPWNGEVLDVCGQGLACYHSAHSRHQVSSHSLRLQHIRQLAFALLDTSKQQSFEVLALYTHRQSKSCPAKL